MHPYACQCDFATVQTSSQVKMGDLFSSVEFARAYIDDLIVATSGTFEDHLNKLERVLKQLVQAGLKVKQKCDQQFFATREELEYLGYLITQGDIKLLIKKLKQ